MLKPGSCTCRDSNICQKIVQRLGLKLFNLINIKMVSRIKKMSIFSISLDMCILLLDIATVNHLQHTRHFCCFPG